MNSPTLPTYDALMNPLLKALRDLGGSASIEEINSKVAEICELDELQLQIPHPRGRRSEVEYRLAWTRTYLKAFGLIENSKRGVWSLTAEGRQTEEVDPRDVVRAMTATQRKGRVGKQESSMEELDPPNEPDTWREQLLDLIISLPPATFERLCQRILRESGFIQVEVTGRSGDGGLDGNGILRLGGLLSFHVSFQCKRWQGTVGPAIIREFRGAMMGRADKGLVMTTSSFTKDAIREATRDGAAAIDLVDGQQLLDMLKDLNLGVKTELVEEVTVDMSWFESI